MSSHVQNGTKKDMREKNVFENQRKHGESLETYKKTIKSQYTVCKTNGMKR